MLLLNGQHPSTKKYIVTEFLNFVWFNNTIKFLSGYQNLLGSFHENCVFLIFGLRAAIRFAFRIFSCGLHTIDRSSWISSRNSSSSSGSDANVAVFAHVFHRITTWALGKENTCREFHRRKSRKNFSSKFDKNDENIGTQKTSRRHAHAMFVTRWRGIWVIAPGLREMRNSLLWPGYRQRCVCWLCLEGSVRECVSSWILSDVNVIFIDVEWCASVRYREMRRWHDFVAEKFDKRNTWSR